VTDTENGSSQVECEATARAFGQSLQQGECEQAINLFDADAAADFVATLNQEGPGLYLSDDPTFVLRRVRRAIQSFYGPVESVSVSESTVRDDAIIVRIQLHCAHKDRHATLTFNQEREIADLSFPDTYSPPAYVDQDAFDEAPITIDCDDIELEGSVTMPVECENPPIAVLIPGAGELDKDYTYGPNRFFKDLAWGLATEGIATLRYDKREAVTEIPPGEQTIERRYVADGIAVLDRAADLSGVDSESLFVIGHSQGGRCGFEIARQYGAVAGVAAIDSPLFKALEQDVEYYQDLLEIDGELPPFVDELSEQYKHEQQRIEKREYDLDEHILGTTGSWLDSSWEYDQFEAAASLSVPLLIYQMDVELRAPAEKRDQWNDVLSNDRDTLIQRPELNHNLQRNTIQGQSILESFLFHRNVDQILVEDVAAWIHDGLESW